jgi:hypothetical protein
VTNAICPGPEANNSLKNKPKAPLAQLAEHLTLKEGQAFCQIWRGPREIAGFQAQFGPFLLHVEAGGNRPKPGVAGVATPGVVRGETSDGYAP